MADSEAHPIKHVDPDLAHQWMREECSSLAQARQAREDNIVSTITQISAAALLGVPALLLSADVTLQVSFGSVLLAIGLLLLAGAVAFAFAEQHYSSVAYERQRELTIAYYQQLSTEVIDRGAVDRTNRARTRAAYCFAAGASIAMVGMFVLKVENIGRTPATPAASLASTTANSTGP